MAPGRTDGFTVYKVCIFEPIGDSKLPLGVSVCVCAPYEGPVKGVFIAFDLCMLEIGTRRPLEHC